MKTTRSAFLKGAGLALAGGVGSLTPAFLLATQEKAGKAAGSDRIDGIEAGLFLLPDTIVAMTAQGPIVSHNVLVRLRTAGGVTGLGESSPFTPVTSETAESDLVLARDLAGVVRGRDPFTIARIVADLEAFAPGGSSIKAAFEMAVWDICGKIAGQPVHRLLGTYRESFETDRTIYVDTPAAMAERALELVRDLGFRCIKVKIGESPELDAQRLAAVRAAVGRDVTLRVDANQGWTPADAVRALHALAQYEIQFCEQPVADWDWAGLKHVRDGSPIPIMADEAVHTPHDAIEGIRRAAMDMINIKVLKAGGILRSVQIAQIAEAAGLPCMLGSMSESRLALTAAAHVVASQRNVVYADLDSFMSQGVDPIVGGMTVKNGIVSLPAGPGLGADVDGAFLKTLKPL
jgi:L-alanine-DL-glutamate epimerase-like enolase superfamily enzyme